MAVAVVMTELTLDTYVRQSEELRGQDRSRPGLLQHISRSQARLTCAGRGPARRTRTDRSMSVTGMPARSDDGARENRITQNGGKESAQIEPLVSSNEYAKSDFCLQSAVSTTIFFPWDSLLFHVSFPFPSSAFLCNLHFTHVHIALRSVIPRSMVT